MTIVHLTTGLPASGKSEHARTLDALRFNLDDMRAMCGIGPETWTDEREQIAKTAMIEGARAAIIAGCSVVLDNTHLVPALPRRYRKEFSQLGVTFQVHDFTDVSVEECIARDAVRSNGVGEAVIRKLAKRHEDARKNGWRLTDKWMNGNPPASLKPYEPNDLLPAAVIVDIDGTVAIHGDERGHYEYEKVSTDRPNPNVISLVRMIADSAPMPVIIMLSGREDRCSNDTKAWLDRHLGSAYWDDLFMRATGDHRPDYIIKGELFDAHVRDSYNVRLVLDDRNQVVNMWRSLGLTCLQVADGAF